MEAIVLSEDQSAEWDAFIAGNPLAIAWQGFGWSEVLARHHEVQFFPIAVLDGTEICGILPLYRLLGRRAGKDLLSVPYAVAGGILADDPAVQQVLLQKAIEIAGRDNPGRIVLKQYKVKIGGDLQTDESYYNRELEISRPLDQVWSELEETNRQCIEQAQRQKPSLEYPSTDIKSFYALLLRHCHRNGIPCASRHWIADLVSSEMYTIALYRLDGRVVAGTMAKTFKYTVSFPFSCVRRSDERGLPFVYALYWDLVSHFSQHGIRIFHSGRIPHTDETDPYRLGWGGTKYPYFVQYYPPGNGPTEYHRRRGRKRAIFTTCWRMLPRPIAGWLGPHVVARFP